ncbi:MAG: molybdopterin-synthase adenylyltransferase MoeB [Deltaproteobacteria bacterium]|nr:molybdopterin-synthase adenylyltransferase MoeB [Deltaproteobacteria bacterium]
MTSFQDHLARVKARIREVSPEEVAANLKSGAPMVLVDVRERDEIENGFLPTANLLGRGHLEAKIASVAHVADAPIVVYCAGGVRSAMAAAALQDMGYTHVRSMAGGFTRWARAGLPVKTRKSLTQSQTARYSRHLLMPEVGEEGQLKLLDAKVLLIGAGGLGSPAAVYLAAAGVGTLGLVDGDAVDMSNLQRQILHAEDRVGMPKVESALKMLRGINSDIDIRTYATRIDSGNVLDIFKDYDIIVDGCDNFPTRYLVNDACYMLGKTNVHGSIFRFEGQVTVFKPGTDGPCYRCLYPEPPPPGMAPSCAEAGVLGVLPGIIGVAQAIEVVKVALDIGKPLVGRLLTFDALQMKFRDLKIRRDPDCPLCGEQPTIKELIDYELFCSMSKD